MGIVATSVLDTWNQLISSDSDVNLVKMERPKINSLWNDLKLKKECDPNLIKDSLPSDCESLSSEDPSDYNNEFTVEDPNEGYHECDYFYNENPFNIAKGRSNNSSTMKRIPMVEEVRLITTSIAFRDNIEKEFINDVAQLINAIVPPECKIDPNLALKLTGCKLIKHYYCPNCHAILHFDESSITMCKHCERGYRKEILKRQKRYFMGISLKEQLEELVNSNLYMHLRKECKDYDVIESEMYKNMAKKMGKNDLSLQWNVSQVKLSVSSPRASTWLIQATVNELPYSLRKNNIFLCSIWHGKTMPRMNVFLRPFIDELIDLRENGLKCTTFCNKKPITIKFHTLFCTVDSRLRASILDINPPGKPYSCPYCLERDVCVRPEIEKESSDDDDKEEWLLLGEKNPRTSDSHRKHCELVVQSGKIVKGVRGASVAMLHPDVDVPLSFPPDYADTCLLGVCRQLVTAWFDPENSDQEFYLGSKVEKFKEKLTSIKRSCEVTREPPQDEFNKYTASDWRNFIFYYSRHCLEDLLPNKYFDHWKLLVDGLGIFSEKAIEDTFFDDFMCYFEEFIELTYKYYPEKYWTYELHLLRHLPAFVNRYGTLWAWSSFPYRRFDDVIQLLFQRSSRESGRDYKPKTLVQAFVRMRFLLNNSSIVVAPDCLPVMTEQFVNIMNDCRIKGCIDYGEELRLLGGSFKSKLLADGKKQFEKLLGEPVKEVCEVYKRFIFRDVLFHAHDCKNLKNIDNSVVMAKGLSFLRIIGILKAEATSGKNTKYLVMARKICTTFEDACSFEGEETKNGVCIEPSEIESKCVAINDYKPGKMLIIPIPNPYETY